MPVPIGPPTLDRPELFRAVNGDAPFKAIVRNNLWTPDKTGAFYALLSDELAAMVSARRADVYYCVWTVSFQAGVPVTDGALTVPDTLLGRIPRLNLRPFTVVREGDDLVVDGAPYRKDYDLTLEDAALLSFEQVLRPEIDCRVADVSDLLVVTPLANPSGLLLYLDNQLVDEAEVAVSDSIGVLDETGYAFSVLPPGRAVPYQVLLTEHFCWVNGQPPASYKTYVIGEFNYSFHDDGRRVAVSYATP